MAGNVLFALSVMGGKNEVMKDININDIFELINNHNSKYFSWHVLGSFPETAWSFERLYSVLEALEKDSFVFYREYKTDNNFVDKLEPLLIASPNNGCLTRLLSIACLVGHKASVEIKAFPGNFIDERYQYSALILRMSQADWDKNEAIRLAEAIIKLAEYQDEAVDSALKVIAAQNLTGGAVELFLYRLFEGLPANTRELRHDVLQAMLEQQRHRQAHVAVLPV
ncbi:hypothetical protein [Methylomonas albis]|uniref:Uncharacterized protein n=1 Tax=Methylomonas albis TaxID=1854563 RepID=A0ABR9CW72_9GAMM|nr:hypothetical protein [Methylomonas albis]MBD9355113.1 hypothetical protein [Methylomonas albis]